MAAIDRQGAIVHAAGRSYGDAALNRGGQAILTRRLDRLIEFDPASGLLVAESGVTFEDLRRVFLPRGFLAPVTPGTAFATLGGAVANDVHGKNQDHAGNFGRHLAWIELMLPSGEVRRLPPDDRLFAATVGGLGLTGVIVALALATMFHFVLRSPFTAFLVPLLPVEVALLIVGVPIMRPVHAALSHLRAPAVR